MVERIGVLGATSFVGEVLLQQLTSSSINVLALSRQNKPTSLEIEWIKVSPENDPTLNEKVDAWVCLSPIITLHNFFETFERSGAKRVVALSSTSLLTKAESSDPKDRLLSQQLADSEVRLAAWAKKTNVEWVILRPTMIYGLGRDRNVSRISNLISRFGFFPLLGAGKGKRQPVHVEDVATACMLTAIKSTKVNCSYNISGGEILSYREMVGRIFMANNKKPRFIIIPRLLFATALTCVKWLPVFSGVSVAMAERMSQDMSFDHSAAKDDFGFSPRLFSPDA